MNVSGPGSERPEYSAYQAELVGGPLDGEQHAVRPGRDGWPPVGVNFYVGPSPIGLYLGPPDATINLSSHRYSLAGRVGEYCRYTYAGTY